MNQIEADFCLEHTKKLLEHPLSLAFQRPVDPELDRAPNYFQVVSHPMDLGTIMRKLEDGEYLSTQEWAEHMNLVWANCMKYNNSNTMVYKEAEILAKKTKQICQRIPKTEHDAWHLKLERLNRKLAKVLATSPTEGCLMPQIHENRVT